MFKKNISLGYMLHILLKFRKFQSEYSCKVFLIIYLKRGIRETNHGVFTFLVLIALSASEF